MNHGSVHTPQLHDWLDRYRAGDRAAADALLRAVGARLEHLAGRMLAAYPNVRRWVDSDDVLQNATLRLLRTLENVRPDSVRSFLNLAGVHVRRELLDLARHFNGPHGIGANHASTPPAADSRPPANDPAAPGDDPADLDRWRQFHEAVERLPAEEREVVSLKFYHGWEEAQIAELFEVTDRTIRRWWRSAGRRLAEQLGGKLPEV